MLGWLGNGVRNADIIEDFPELSEELIRACLRFAADRQRHTRLVAR